MAQKPTWFNNSVRDVIDPTASKIGIVLYTVRYWIVLGAVFNIMPLCFMVMTVLANIHWLVMYVIYTLHLMKYKKLWVSQALAILDEERTEFYAVRSSKKL